MFDSYESPLAKQYERMKGIKVKPSVLVQTYIEAEESAVISERGRAYYKGSCENIVNGLEGVTKDVPSDFLEIYDKLKAFL